MDKHEVPADRLADLEKEIAQLRVDIELWRLTTKEKFHNPEQGVKLLREQAGKDGRTLPEAVKALAQANPEFVHSNSPQEERLPPGQDQVVVAILGRSYSRREILADGDLSNKIALKDPVLYRKIRGEGR